MMALREIHSLLFQLSGNMYLRVFFKLWIGSIMKKIFLLLLLASASVTAQTSNESVLRKSLNTWSLLSINDRDGIVTLVMDDDRVAPQAYESVILMGVCAPFLSQKAHVWYLKNTSEVHVVNRVGHTGFAFESPRNSCKEVAQSKGDEASLVISTHTRGLKR
ncbi:hypothetical protein SB6412_02608 [Klebsiella pasteurii]|uniref:hypothetical protein n=1 Tax=Klebsiella TaxID=570 RepID=UPI0011575256|nr:MULTISPECIES: hypothetical protein [Klebsiella]MEB6368983.1 hypothetical protein [Klebsiella michiganensis]UXO80943.1 hypothetical protein N7918_11515 [Klebsiella michiganensis]VUS54073.1 hypothetical protein SB6412_02608 [Klebsiella pasteurii]